MQPSIGVLALTESNKESKAGVQVLVLGKYHNDNSVETFVSHLCWWLRKGDGVGELNFHLKGFTQAMLMNKGPFA